MERRDNVKDQKNASTGIQTKTDHRQNVTSCDTAPPLVVLPFPGKLTSLAIGLASLFKAWLTLKLTTIEFPQLTKVVTRFPRIGEPPPARHFSSWYISRTPCRPTKLHSHLTSWTASPPPLGPPFCRL